LIALPIAVHLGQEKWTNPLNTSSASLRFEVSGNDNNFLDELRIGSIYSAVTIPEPATLVLLMLTTIGWYLRRGRPADLAKEGNWHQH
jgi:hypothetical protein